MRILLGLLALGSATGARAASDACVTPAELNATLTYTLPAFVDTVAHFCRPVLAHDGFMATQSGDLATRYRAGQAAAWPVVRTVLRKFGGGGFGKFALMLPDTSLQDMLDGYVHKAVADGIHSSDCADLEDAMALLAPLPPENTAGLIGLFVRRDDQKDAKISGPAKKLRLPLCLWSVDVTVKSSDPEQNSQPAH